MEAAIAQFEEARAKRLTAQEQLVKIHNRIKESTFKLKRYEAEVEELDGLKDDALVLNQIGRIFVERSVIDTRKSLKQSITQKEDELPRLRVVGDNFQKLVESTTLLCQDAEATLAKAARAGAKENFTKSK